jgi:hypothetical protein
MHIKRISLPSIAAAASPTLSFFSGGNGGHADWFVTDDQPPVDMDTGM